MNDFDGIAWCYDALKKLVFGDALDEAASHYLHKIPVGSNVLIIGGGTGRLLNDFPVGVQITYIEKSGKMLKYARKRSSGDIDFHHIDFLDYLPTHSFNFVVCPFFLDLFNPELLKEVIKKIQNTLHPGGQLLVADFSYRQSLLISLMYKVFSVVSKISGDKILPIQDLLINSGFQLIESTTYLNGLVFSSRFRRVTN